MKTKTYPGGTSQIHDYKGVSIEQMWFGSEPFEFSIYPMFIAAGREKEVGGSGSWTAETLTAAHAKIDGFLSLLGLKESPSPQLWRPTSGMVRCSLTSEQLVFEIKSMSDAQRMVSAITNPILQVSEGLPLPAWKVEIISGCCRFGRFDEIGNVTHIVVVVNAPESRRAEYDSGKYETPTTVLMVG